MLFVFTIMSAWFCNMDLNWEKKSCANVFITVPPDFVYCRASFSTILLMLLIGRVQSPILNGWVYDKEVLSNP